MMERITTKNESGGINDLSTSLKPSRPVKLLKSFTASSMPASPVSPRSLQTNRQAMQVVRSAETNINSVCQQQSPPKPLVTSFSEPHLTADNASVGSDIRIPSPVAPPQAFGALLDFQSQSCSPINIHQERPYRSELENDYILPPTSSSNDRLKHEPLSQLISANSSLGRSHLGRSRGRSDRLYCRPSTQLTAELEDNLICMDTVKTHKTASSTGSDANPCVTISPSSMADESDKFYDRFAKHRLFPTNLTSTESDGSSFDGRRKKFGFVTMKSKTWNEVNKYRYLFPVLFAALLYSSVALFLSIMKELNGKVTTNSENNEESIRLNETMRDSLWTQEAIYGWHKQRPLILKARSLGSEGTINNGPSELINIKIRECRSSIPLKKIVTIAPITTTSTSTSTKSPGLDYTPSLNTSSQLSIKSTPTPFIVNATSAIIQASTSIKPIIRKHHIKFEALNGCLFRLDGLGETHGDRCCCAGPPRFIMVPEWFTASNSTFLNGTITFNITSGTYHNITNGRQHHFYQPGDYIKLSHNDTIKYNKIEVSNLTTADPKFRTTETSRPPKPIIETSDPERSIQTFKMKRWFLRPRIMCFKSSSIFNPDKVVAPIVNENNLRNTFVKDHDKCITCSCCHGNSPDIVNKLLANVPLDTPETLPVVVDQHGNRIDALEFPSNGTLSVDGLPLSDGDLDKMDKQDDGVWDTLRERLIAGMKSIDDFFFNLYDLISTSLIVMRYGEIPANYSDSNGLILGYHSIGPTMQVHELINLDLKHMKKDRSISETIMRMYIEEDLYDAFTTTTTTTPSSTSSTTTLKPEISLTTQKTPRRRSKKNGKKKSKQNKVITNSTEITITTTKKPEVIIELTNKVASIPINKSSIESPIVKLVVGGIGGTTFKPISTTNNNSRTTVLQRNVTTTTTLTSSKTVDTSPANAADRKDLGIIPSEGPLGLVQPDVEQQRILPEASVGKSSSPLNTQSQTTSLKNNYELKELPPQIMRNTKHQDEEGQKSIPDEVAEPAGGSSILISLKPGNNPKITIATLANQTKISAIEPAAELIKPTNIISSSPVKLETLRSSPTITMPTENIVIENVPTGGDSLSFAPKENIEKSISPTPIILPTYGMQSEDTSTNSKPPPYL